MSGGYGNPTYRPEQSLIDPRATEGVLTRRFFAYLVDLVVIALLIALFWVLIGIIGLVTFGIGWILFALLPLTAIIYNAVTIGGRNQATIGMRVAGVRVLDAYTAGRPSMLQAAVHALLFYIAASTAGLLLVADIVIGFFRGDHRVGHDILSGVTLVRAF